MRNIYLFMAVCLLTLACGGNQETSEGNGFENDTARWHIAVLPTLDCMPLLVADERGFFADEGLSLSLHAYQAQMDADTALTNGRVVAAVTDLARVEHMLHEGARLRCPSATDASWQLLSMRQARITKLPQLDDKMMAMTRYSATDLLSDLVVDSAKLKAERVFRIQVNDIAVRLGMLQSGIMDAMFLPEPQATAARNVMAHVLYDTRKDSLFLGCIAFNEDSLKGHEQELQKFLRAYDRAVDSLNEQGIHTYDGLMQSSFNLPAAVIDSLSSNYRFRHAHAPRQTDIDRAKQWWEKRVASMKYVEKRYLQ